MIFDQLSLFRNAQSLIDDHYLFLNLINSDEYIIRRLWSIKEGDYYDSGFRLNVEKLSSCTIFLLLNVELSFLYVWGLDNNVYIGDNIIPHEILWILDVFKFGD